MWVLQTDSLSMSETIPDEDIKVVSMALLLTLCIERKGLETVSSLHEKSATLD